MSPLIYEAQLIGFKEACKVGIVWLVLYSSLHLKNRKELIIPFYAGLFAAFCISAISFFIPSGLVIKEYIGNIISMSFAFFLLASAASLLHTSGVNLFGSGGVPHAFKNTAVGNSIIFLLTLVFFSPDILGSMLFLKELSFMKESAFLSYLSAFVGVLIAMVIFFAVIRFYKPFWVGGFFDVPQLLLFLAMVKLFGSGIKGVAELSLLPSVQRGFMKFIHDFIHQTFVIMMVPDHPLLKTTTWNFIAFFFGPNFASAVSLIILLLLPFMFIYNSLVKPVPALEAQTGAQKRKLTSLVLHDRRKKALPVMLFVCLMIGTWFLQTGETVSRIYVPKAKPVVVDKGIVVIPVQDPTMKLMDGALHTFSLVHDGEEIRIMIIKKPDNSLSVCLDACEICPPEGYGQREDHVVCLYCDTPIQTSTLGAPGGCNPIPLEAEIDDRFVRIDLKEILKKWGYIMSGTGGEVNP